MTTSWSRSFLWHFRYSGDNIKILHTLSTCCGSRCGYTLIGLRFNDCWNPQFGCAGLRISYSEVIGCIPPSWLCQFIKIHLLQPKPLHALGYDVGYYAHNPAGLLILAQLAMLCLFFILLFPILPINGACNIVQTVSSRNHHLMKDFFVLSGCQSCIFSFLCIFLLLPNRCLCMFNSLHCTSGFSLQHNPRSISLSFHCLRIVFLVISRPQASFWSQGAQCTKGSDSFWLWAALALIRLMTSSCRMLCWFAVFASQKWWEVHFLRIDHCSLYSLCCWARCWMLQDMDSMEESCVFYAKVGMLNHLEHSQIWLVTVNKTGIVRLTILHNLIVSVSFMYYPGDFWWQTSADILSLEEYTINVRQQCGFTCHTWQFIPGNKRTTSDQLVVSLWTVGIPCNLQPYAAGFNLSITYNLATTSSILTWS